MCVNVKHPAIIYRSKKWQDKTKYACYGKLTL
jgi:hypothetical protein